MSNDLGDLIGAAVGKAARDAIQNVSANAKKASSKRLSDLSGAKGVATGAGIAVLAPLAAKGAGMLVRSGVANPAKKVGEKVGDLGEKVGDSVGGAVGGAPGLAKDAAKGMIPGGGGGKSKSKGQPGVGKGRRMPIQQAIDVAAPLKTAYNQWTQFEDWPKFMHRLEQVSQEDETHVRFKTKIWGISKEFEAEIVEQVPDERIKWRVVKGVTHTGVVTFHELAPRLTRIEVNFDVQPGGLIEKAARGMRHVKRAVRADLSRFKAYIEMEAEETGAWRGRIDDGKVKSSSSSGSSSGSRSRSTSSGSRSRSSSSGSRSRSGSSGSRSRTRATSRSGSSRSSSSGSSRKSSGSSPKSSGSSRSSSGSSSRSSGSSNGRKSPSSRSTGSSNGRKTTSSRSSGSSSARKTTSSRSSNGSGGSRSSTRKKTSSTS